MWFEGNTHDVVSLDRATFGRVSADVDKLVVTDSLFFGKVETLPDGFSAVRSGLSCNRYVAQLQVCVCFAFGVSFRPSTVLFLRCFFVSRFCSAAEVCKTDKRNVLTIL